VFENYHCQIVVPARVAVKVARMATSSDAPKEGEPKKSNKGTERDLSPITSPSRLSTVDLAYYKLYRCGHLFSVGSGCSVWCVLH
jgi:hypothetical protein